MPSRPTCSPLRWADLPASGARVGVWGVGTEGRATLAKLEALGVAPAVVVDDDPATPGAVATGEGGLEALTRCEVIIKSPGISRYRPEVEDLEVAGACVVGGLGLWLETVGPERVIGITGTKGKSTTTSVAGHLARNLGADVSTGGNLGVPPWDPDVADHAVWIVEVSSYQATDLWSSPAVAAVTSLHPDHLSWHGTVERYYADKLSLCSKPGGRVSVLNGTDEQLLAHASELGPGPLWITPGDGDGWTGELGLRGRHNVVNALIAARCLAEMGVPGADDPDRLRAAAAGYRALPSRLTTIALRGGIEFVDDSLSTNVLPTIAATEVFADRPLALIAGGHDRHIDYEPLARHLATRNQPTVVLTVPTNGDRVAEALERSGVATVRCSSVREAVNEAAARVAPGGVVLLSPAAASFGTYRDYRERAADFASSVMSLFS